MANVMTLDRAIKYLTESLRDVDPSHGIAHSIEVMKHAENAISCAPFEIGMNEQLCILLAALAHDLDDRKYFQTVDYANAREMIRAINQHDNEELIIKMISIVSCSGNGNRTDPDLPVWMYYPRWADRICGMDVSRLIAGAMLKNRPLFIGDVGLNYHQTFIYDNEEDLRNSINPIAFEAYSTPSNPIHGKLISVVDHCYTVLLNIPVDTSNEYFNKQFKEADKKVVKFCLTFAGQEVAAAQYPPQPEEDDYYDEDYRDKDEQCDENDQ